MAVTYPKIVLTLSDTSTLTWQNTEIIKADLVEEMHPISALLPISVLNAQIYDAADSFSIFDDAEVLSERQTMMLYEVVNGVEYFLGKYYLDDWKTPTEKTLELRAVDIVGIMDTTPFDGYFWASQTAIETILDIVLAGIDVDYDLADALKSVKLQGYIRSGTVRDALQQVCFAAGGAVITSRRENIAIVESPIPYSSGWHQIDIGANAKFMDQPTELNPLVTGIELIGHTYEKNADLEVVYEDDLEPGNHKIIFDGPTYLASISGAIYEESHKLVTHGGDYLVTHGGDYLVAAASYEKGINAVNITVPEPGGTVTMMGYVWRDNQRVYRFTETAVTATKENKLRVEDATLVSTQNAERVLARLRDYYRGRYIHNMMMVLMNGAKYGDAVYGAASYGWSTTSLKIGQMASITSLQGPLMRSVFEKVNTDLTGGFLMSITAVGIKTS